MANKDSKTSKSDNSNETNYIIENVNYKSSSSDDYYKDNLPEMSKKNKCKKHDKNKYCDVSNVFYPICCNGICNVPRMDHMTIVAEGKGTISESELNPEVEETSVGCGCGCKNCQGAGPETPDEESTEIAFNFTIGKKFSKYVGELCIVNYDEKIFLTSNKLECYHSPDHTRFVAVFHVEESEDVSREIVIFASTKICTMPPTLFVYSAPYCESLEEISMGGAVTTGTITIFKNSDDNSGMAH